MSSSTVVSLGVLLMLSGCGGSSFEDAKGAGGTSYALGGQNDFGGTSTGGALGGSVSGTGGAAATGGTLTLGGGKATGGAVGVGGDIAGTTGNGGAAFGGTNAIGGSNATGGTYVWTGGVTDVSTGGNRATGGSPNTGGAPVTGGTRTSGGALQTGGTKTTGGFVSTGGAATGASSGVDERPGAPCTTANDCKLMNDCCTCDVYAAAANPPACNSPCKQPLCDSMGISSDDVACVAGRCVFSLSCDVRRVACEMTPPHCDPGTVPSVKGACYGPCLPVGRCSSVSSCNECESAGLACARLQAIGEPSYHCVLTARGCGTDSTCECMGVCTGSNVCSAASSGDLTCVCPFC
jgi:hypothetical protein